MRWQLAYILLFIAGLSIAFSVMETNLSPSYQKCVETDNNRIKAEPNIRDRPAVKASATIFLECSGTFLDDHGAGITAIATMVIAAFTGTLWRATTRQSDLTREALIADRSAFVFPVGFKQDYEHVKNTGHCNWRFRPIWCNSGNTAAVEVQISAICEIRNSAFPPGHSFDYTIGNQQKGFIGPQDRPIGGLAPALGQAAITPQDIIDAQNSHKYIYLWGWARYRDVFPETRRHITKFCWVVQIQGDPLTYVPNTQGPPGTPGTLYFTWLQHSEGNTVKDE